MKYPIKIITSLIVISFLASWFFSPVAAISSFQQTTDVVYTEEELASWIANLSSEGDALTLGTSIHITQTYFIVSQQPVTIYTGSFGFIYDGGCLRSDTNILTITGEGVDLPVVDVYSIKTGPYRSGNWNNELSGPNIIATGKNGSGGTALRISSVDNKSFNLGAIVSPGHIRSYGTGAVGIHFAVFTQAYCLQIEVEGNNSTAISAPQGVSLFYSSLTASGNNASSAQGNNIIFDSCTASPISSHIIHRPRTILDGSLYFPVAQNSAIANWDIPFFFIALLSGGESYPAVYRALPVQWDMEACANIDTSVLGKTSVFGKVPLGFTDISSVSPELIIDVRNPALPCIDKVIIKNNGETEYAVFPLWQDYHPENGNITFWQSNDNGKTWQDITWSPKTTWDINSIYFLYDNLTRPIQFMLKVDNVGVSNIVTLSPKNRLSIYGIGGDRTGVDREVIYTDDADDEPQDTSDKQTDASNTVSSNAQAPTIANSAQQSALPAFNDGFSSIEKPSQNNTTNEIAASPNAHSNFSSTTAPSPDMLSSTVIYPAKPSATTPLFPISGAYIVLFSIIVATVIGILIIYIFLYRGKMR